MSVLNPHQWSSAKQSSIEFWKVMPQKCQNKLKPKGMVWLTRNITISINCESEKTVDALKTLWKKRSRLINKIYWKEKETHMLTFKTSDLLWVQILSCWQQFIPTYTDNKIPQQISLIFADDTFHLRWRHCHVQAYTDYTWENNSSKTSHFRRKLIAE